MTKAVGIQIDFSDMYSRLDAEKAEKEQKEKADEDARRKKDEEDRLQGHHDSLAYCNQHATLEWFEKLDIWWQYAGQYGEYESRYKLLPPEVVDRGNAYREGFVMAALKLWSDYKPKGLETMDVSKLSDLERHGLGMRERAAERQKRLMWDAMRCGKTSNRTEVNPLLKLEAS